MKKAMIFISVLLSAVMMFTGCTGESSGYREHIIYGMDTYITFKLSCSASDGSEIDDGCADELERECSQIISNNEMLMSSHNDDAMVYGLNHGVERIDEAAETLISILRMSIDISNKTAGAYNPALGSLTELWNVSGGGPVPSDADITSALEHISADCITVTDNSVSKSDPDCHIDLGGIGKGYTAQEIVEHLASKGVSYGLVSMGGNVGVFGVKEDSSPFKIGICDPNNTSSVLGYLSIESGFISVSGDYERYFEENGRRYHHIIDPDTGYPAESGLRSVAVWSNNGAVSDALSTALFVMGTEKSLEFYRSGDMHFEAIFITNENEIILTDGLSDGAFELSGSTYSIKSVN